MNDIAIKNGYVQCPYCGSYYLKSGVHCCEEMVAQIDKSPYSSSTFESLSKQIKEDFSRPNYSRSEPDPSIQARLFSIPSNDFHHPTADFIRKQEYIKTHVNGDWDSPYRCKRVLDNFIYITDDDLKIAKRLYKMQMIDSFLKEIPDVENFAINFNLSIADSTIIEDIARRCFQRADGQWVFEGNFVTKEKVISFVKERIKTLTMTAKKHITCKNCEYYDGYDCERLGLQSIDSNNYCSWAKERIIKK